MQRWFEALLHPRLHNSLQASPVADGFSAQDEIGTEESQGDSAEQEGELVGVDNVPPENEEVHEVVDPVPVQAGAPFVCNTCSVGFEKAATLRKHKIKQ